MPRIGMNPSRSKTLDYTPARVTVAVMTYLPNQVGYFQHRFDVTRLTIESILANTSKPYDLLVLDNGSCPEMVEYLVSLNRAGKIDQLILSKHNMGKLNALYRIMQAAPGEIIAYTDDDVFFLPGWLEAHLEIIDTFPNVGAVTGFYIRQRVNMSSDSTLKFAENGADATRRGLLMPRKWEEEYMDNSGRTEARYQEEVAGIEDIIVKYKGLEAWVSAHHFQVVTPKAVIVPILEEMLTQGWSDQLMGRMVEMDDRMDAKGYLRFCTLEQTVMLMGNAINKEIAQVAEKYGLNAAEVDQPTAVPKLEKNRYVQNIMQRLINFLYKRLNT